jgi:hypothetical protein
VKQGAIAIDLPLTLSMAAARGINCRAALREGVPVRDGAARFSRVAEDALSQYGCRFAEASRRQVCPTPSRNCAFCENDC